MTKVCVWRLEVVSHCRVVLNGRLPLATPRNSYILINFTYVFFPARMLLYQLHSIFMLWRQPRACRKRRTYMKFWGLLQPTLIRRISIKQYVLFVLAGGELSPVEEGAHGSWQQVSLPTTPPRAALVTTHQHWNIDGCLWSSSYKSFLWPKAIW